MAGSAMAFSAQIYTSPSGEHAIDNPINMTAGETKTVYLGGTQIESDFLNKDFTWIGDVTGATSGASTGQLTITVPDSSFKPDSSSYIDPRPITIHLDGDAPEGASYSIRIGASFGSEEGLYQDSVVSRIVRSVPEFPTIALPLAAVIGLVFIFGCKKEGM
ncbi:PEF-CTERM sorting domain-containing protein [Methanosarcina siciliae]|uniref:PEF-CTERM sorting domain-containing protein n=1 Tax=Methanosarcina siciliae TaxID=38027 RepID=UPI0018CE929E|nr:PEF-CTERM sorting domain-containing protein [Methanosarcina siciliae]